MVRRDRFHGEGAGCKAMLELFALLAGSDANDDLVREYRRTVGRAELGTGADAPVLHRRLCPAVYSQAPFSRCKYALLRANACFASGEFGEGDFLIPPAATDTELRWRTPPTTGNTVSPAVKSVVAK